LPEEALNPLVELFEKFAFAFLRKPQQAKPN
jgi:hypothetical protein